MTEVTIFDATRMQGVALRSAGMALLVALAGCAEFDRALEPPPVDPSSPIAAYAQRVSEEPFAMPSLISVPPKPSDVRPASGYKAAVVDEVDLRRELLAWRAEHPESDPNTETWAAEQRSRIPGPQAAPVAPSHEADAEAFAKKLRDAAVKPQ